MKTCLRLTGIGVLAAATVMGQVPDSRFPIHGEISPMVPATETLTVELSGNGPSEQTLVKADGTFDLRPVDPGTYELRIFSTGGALLHQETVVISNSRETLSIRIPTTTNTSRPGDNTISARQLAHKVPAQARKALDKGEHAESKGDHQKAAQFFREAVSIDPEFADGFNDLGAAQAGQGDLPGAIESFQKAIDLVPEHRLALTNMSIVLAKSKRWGEAAVVSRRALQFSPGSGVLRYILASSLLYEKGESDEVLDNLERSAGEVPLAHLMAAEILAHRGKREEAAQQIEDYLRAAPSDDKHRPRAEAMLASLRS
jgi:tetratricopeptide (TPR) repeat protein